MAMILLLLSFPLWAQSTPEERALILNEEMDFLLKSAPQVRVYAAPSNAAAPARGSGLSPSQMPAGVESLEDNYFSDEVRFQAAAADTINPSEDSAPAPEEDMSYLMDGGVPKTATP
jgi:hypothetical protein